MQRESAAVDPKMPPSPGSAAGTADHAQRAATGMIGGVLSRLKEAGGVADTHATGHGAGQAGQAGAGDSPDQVRGDAQPRWLRVRPGTQRALELVEPRRDRVEPASS